MTEYAPGITWQQRAEAMEERLAWQINECFKLSEELTSMRQRLGQYEAQYAHDHNLWRASRIGHLEAEIERLRTSLAAANERAVRWEDKVSQYGRELAEFKRHS